MKGLSVYCNKHSCSLGGKQMNQRVADFMERSREALYRAIFPPNHQQFLVTGVSIEECLRELERAAELPRGDLSFSGDSREVASWPTVRKGISHSIISATGICLRGDQHKLGYISGSVVAFFERGTASEGAGPGLVKQLLASADEAMFSGKLHVVTNCEGVFHRDVCQGCGYELR